MVAHTHTHTHTPVRPFVSFSLSLCCYSVPFFLFRSEGEGGELWGGGMGRMGGEGGGEYSGGPWGNQEREVGTLRHVSPPHLPHTTPPSFVFLHWKKGFSDRHSHLGQLNILTF